MAVNGHSTLLQMALFLAACGGSGAASEEPTAADGSAGGETPPGDDPASAPLGPTAISVPSAAVDRGALRPELQRLWVEVEEAAAVRPPPPPEASTEEAVSTWARGLFLEWIERRRAAIGDAQQVFVAIEEPVAAWERGLGAGLLAFVYEDSVAAMRGAPVPDSISADAELLAAYTGALDEALRPYAQAAAEAYAVCAQQFVEWGDGLWRTWAEHCATRARDVVTTYGIDVPPAGAADPDEME